MVSPVVRFLSRILKKEFVLLIILFEYNKLYCFPDCYTRLCAILIDGVRNRFRYLGF